MNIRTATPDDGASISEIYAPYVRDTVISFETDIPTAGEMTRRIAATLEAFPWLVCEEDGDKLGYAYAGKHRQRAAYQWSCDVTIYLAPRAQRRGIGRRLYKALFDILVHQGFAAAYAGITLPNEASVGIHEAMGFRPVWRLQGRRLQERKMVRCRVVASRLAGTRNPARGSNPVSGPWQCLI